MNQSNKFELSNTTTINHIKLNKILSYSDNFINDECSICLESLDNGTISILSTCCHKYHEKCINEWFNLKSIKKCPECNTINNDMILINPPKYKKNKIIDTDINKNINISNNDITNGCSCIIS